MENTTLTSMASERLPLKVKVAYGLSGYSSFITWTIFSLYGLYFFTDIVGISAAFAGAMISLGTLWDAITDPIVGSISDSIKSEKGRRRPLIIGVALPFAVISILLFTNFAFDEATSKVYFVIIILLYYTLQTILDISCSALGSEMTLNYDERSSLATYKNFFAMLVMVIISPTLVMTDFFGGWFKNSDFGWSMTLACYMVLALFCIYTIWRTTKGYERHRENTERIKASDIKEVFKNKPVRMVMAIFLLGVFGNTINTSLQVYYMTYYVQMTAGQIASLMLVAGITACVATFGVDWLCIRISKKLAWIISVGLEAAVLLIFIGMIIHPGNVGLVFVCFILIQLGVCAVYQVPWSMIPDCVDVNELASGKRIDGIIFGLVAFIQKCAGAVAIAAVGAVLTAIGYTGDGNMVGETLTAMKLFYGIGCAVIFGISILVVLKYPLTKKRHDELLQAIDDRHAGKEINMDDFKDLI